MTTSDSNIAQTCHMLHHLAHSRQINSAN